MKLLITLIIITNLHSYSERESYYGNGKSWAENRANEISRQREYEERKKEQEKREYERKLEEIRNKYKYQRSNYDY